MTASTAIVQLRADPMMRGRILALQALVFLGSTPIGGPILGFISQRYGSRYGLAVGGLAGLGAALYGVLAARKARRGDQRHEARSPRGDHDLTAPGLAPQPVNS